MRRLLVLPVFAAFAAAALLADDPVLPDGKAKKLIENSCTECHGLDQVTGSPMSREQWRSTVTSMVKKGATLSPAEIDSVVDYLAIYFAPDKVNVNTASAKEMQNGLNLTPEEVSAVLELRKKGPIKDLSALSGAAGLDAKKIEAKKDLILF